jgi:putative endonuclease
VPVAPKRPRARREELPERHARGRAAEQAAEASLREQGFRILWRNVRIGALEIDLVAKKDDLVVIAEVRTRGPGSYERALESIGPTKRRLLLRASRGLWRGRLSKMPDVMRVRIDVAAVTLEDGAPPRVEWIRGAITENDA